LVPRNSPLNLSGTAYPLPTQPFYYPVPLPP
jgi:hypothetical protein